jgi:hypothetical protein
MENPENTDFPVKDISVAPRKLSVDETVFRK